MTHFVKTLQLTTAIALSFSFAPSALADEGQIEKLKFCASAYDTLKAEETSVMGLQKDVLNIEAEQVASQGKIADLRNNMNTLQDEDGNNQMASDLSDAIDAQNTIDRAYTTKLDQVDTAMERYQMADKDFMDNCSAISVSHDSAKTYCSNDGSSDAYCATIGY